MPLCGSSSGDACGAFRLAAELAAEPLGVPARPHLGVQAERLADLALGLCGPPERASAARLSWKAGSYTFPPHRSAISAARSSKRTISSASRSAEVAIKTRARA